MKRKVLFSALSIIIIAVAFGAGTMAWFTAKAEAPDNTFTAGTVMIRAGSSVTMTQDMTDYWEQTNVFPELVISSDQGTRPDGGPVRSQRSNPDAVLSLDEGQSESNFYSLGFFMDEESSTPGNSEETEYWAGRGGEIIVRFSEPISTYDGRLLLVAEDTWGGWPVELADVAVSQNGTDWSNVGTADNTIGVPQSYSYITVPDSVEWFQYVKVVDKTNPYVHPDGTSLEDWWSQANNDAFDLNAILVQSWIRKNWNPGDCDEVNFYVRNTGSKDIRVRAKLSADWELDFDWLWENWDALCFSEMDRFGDQDSWSREDFEEALDSPETVVSIELCNGQEQWTKENGFFYYTGEPIESGQEAELCLEVCLDGELANNIFQGGKYTLKVTFEAVQSSNYAPYYEWDGINLYGVPDQVE